MNKNLLATILIIAISITLIGGSTFAWFTAVAEVPDNEFTAGTVIISADREAGIGKTITENWNPGDCEDLNFEVINQGTKSIYLRAKVMQRWMPSFLRLLVVYTGDGVQLLAVEWDSTCKGCTGVEGPIASGMFTIAGYPADNSYIDGKFWDLSNQDWLQNGSGYLIWCMDDSVSINKNVDYEVLIFDPMCNPTWYEEVVYDFHQNLIDESTWAKIVYIINGEFLERGYSSDDIQSAIWYFTNGTTPPSIWAQEIVDETNDNWDLSTDNVSVNFGANWIEGTDGYWYYNESIPGTFGGLSPAMIIMDGTICLDGASTGNEYQGKVFNMTVVFEAIQSSNQAAYDAWGYQPPTND